MEKIKNRLNKSHGFTLIELAIVLVIVGLLMGMGAGIVGTLTKRAKLFENRGIIDAAVESLISYAASNNDLPDIATFPTVVRNPNDVWKKPLYYIVDDDLLDSTAGGICDRKSTQLEIDNCPTTGCGAPTNTIYNVAFIILSGSTNFNNQTTGSAAVTSDTTVNHYAQELVLDDYNADVNRAEPYDDIVKWITLDELRIKAGCKTSPIRIVNNELPYGFQDSSYSASIYGDGGVPFADDLDPGSEPDYEWCWEDDPVNGPPAGITFTCDTALASSATCSLITGTWKQCTTVILAGTATASGSYMTTFFVRDENDDTGADDNISQKSFVITVNPASGGGGCTTTCTDFRVWNNLGSNFYFLRDGYCNSRNNGQEVTNGGRRLNSGETIEQHGASDSSCGSAVATLTFDDAKCADTDADCRINFDGTDL